jgi:hypothetical protein
MVMAFVVAAVFSGLAAAGAIRDDRVPYWWRWDKAALVFAVGLICLIYAGNGLLVTGIAEHMDWHVIKSGSVAPWVNGLVYGLAAFLLLRWDVATLGFTALNPARHLVDSFLAQFGGWLEAGAARGVARAVGNLQPVPLCCVSLQAFLRHVEPELLEHQAEGHLSWLVNLHVEVLADGERLDSDVAQSVIAPVERLRHWVEVLIVNNHDATIDLREQPQSSIARMFRPIDRVRKRL